MVIPSEAAVQLPDARGNETGVAPLMCADTIGYRSLKLADMADGMVLGLFGFGSANHLALQMAIAQFPASRKFVFSRNPEERRLAALGAHWVGDVDDEFPVAVDRAIDTTPAWRPVLRVLERLRPGAGWWSTQFGRSPTIKRPCSRQTSRCTYGWRKK